MTLFCCLYCQLWTYFTPCPSVSVVGFEEVHIDWVVLFSNTQNRPIIIVLSSFDFNIFIHIDRFQYIIYIFIVCTPNPLSVAGGGGGWVFTESLLGKRGVSFFGGVCSFYIKNKLKSEKFHNKKSLQTKMFFSVITKNLNWEILSKNFVTFKRWDAV